MNHRTTCRLDPGRYAAIPAMEDDVQLETRDQGTPGPQRFGRALPILCSLYAIAVITFWLLIRYASQRWWPATVLLYTPRWPLLVPLLVLVPWAWRKRRKLVWLPLATGLFVL